MKLLVNKVYPLKSRLLSLILLPITIAFLYFSNCKGDGSIIITDNSKDKTDQPIDNDNPTDNNPVDNDNPIKKCWTLAAICAIILRNQSYCIHANAIIIKRGGIYGMV